MIDVFAGSPRTDILTQLDLDGAPLGTAVRVIDTLAKFGQDVPGRESLGVLINKLIGYLGGGAEADFLRDVYKRYKFRTQPVAAAQGIGDWHGKETDQSVAEKIIGENTLRDVYMLEVLIDLSKAVARVSGLETGTGFLITNNLLMTNNHVINSAEVAEKCDFQFNYQLGRNGKELPVLTARARTGGLFRTSPSAPYNATPDQLDYTVVELVDVPRGVAPLTLKPAVVKPDNRLTIIQHSGGHYKKISMQNNFVEYVDEHVVQYSTSTEPGSSGSPLISDDFEVVGIHHGGGIVSEPLTKRHYLRNEGIRMSAILNDLQQNAPNMYALIAR